MKYLLAVNAIAAAVSAQSIPSLVAQIPACALSCFILNVPTVCPKGVTDYGCQCSHQAPLRATITPCVVKACTPAEQATVASLSTKICDTYDAANGISSSAPASSAAASSMASSAASAAASSMSSMAASMTGASMAMTSSGALPAATTGVMSAASAASSAAASAAGNAAAMATAAPFLAGAMGVLALAL